MCETGSRIHLLLRRLAGGALAMRPRGPAGVAAHSQPNPSTPSSARWRRTGCGTPHPGRIPHSSTTGAQGGGRAPLPQQLAPGSPKPSQVQVRHAAAAVSIPHAALRPALPRRSAPWRHHIPPPHGAPPPQRRRRHLCKNLRLRRVVPPAAGSLDTSPECVAPVKPGSVESTPPEAASAAAAGSGDLDRKLVLARSKLVRDPRSFGYRRLLPFLNEMMKNGFQHG
ncbi:uncharacterized protein [Miscanthus floridulus]|uniref:uncharacterized protein n=1 Tax=Miscanthus floridulus TaxID=154761 RepID=UPI00345AA329